MDDCELRRPPPSYTIDTVEEIRRRESDAEIYYLIGEDNVATLQWHRFAELEKMVRFVVSIAPAQQAQRILTTSCAARSTFPPRRSERELRPDNRFVISYRQR